MVEISKFGWLSGTSATTQANVLNSALDSGEPLALPVGTVVVDQPLVMKHCPSLVGWGGDASVQALATSQIRCPDPAVDMLLVTKHHAHLAGFNVHGEGQRGGGTGRGIVIGEGATEYLRGVVLERVTVNQFHHVGVDIVAAGGYTIDQSCIWGTAAGIRIQNVLHADTGDGRIRGSDINAGPDGTGLLWLSGGGLYISGGCKFNHGRHHITMEWNAGGSGNFALIGCSLETCGEISVKLGGKDQFKRMQIVGNTFSAANACCIAVGNALVEDVTIAGNTLSTHGPHPVIDLVAAQRVNVTGNVVNGNGQAGVGIMARSECVDGRIRNNLIVGCTSAPVQTDHASTLWDGQA